MKSPICSKCGYRNTELSKNCTNCGAELEDMPDEAKLAAMLKKMSDRSDELTPSTFDKVMMWVLFAEAPVCLFLCASSKIQGGIIAGIFMAMFSVTGAVFAGHPKIMWELDKFRINIFANTGDMTPTDFWSIGRKISYCLIGICMIAISLMLRFGE